MSTTTKNETKAYQRLRDIAEAHGYRMSFERKGYLSLPFSQSERSNMNNTDIITHLARRGFPMRANLAR